MEGLLSHSLFEVLAAHETSENFMRIAADIAGCEARMEGEIMEMTLKLAGVETNYRKSKCLARNSRRSCTRTTKSTVCLG